MAKIGTIATRPSGPLGGAESQARWLNQLLISAGHEVVELTPPMPSVLANKVVWALGGEAARMVELTRVMRANGPFFDAYICHQACGWTSKVGLNIFHTNNLCYAERRYGRLHPNYYRIRGACCFFELLGGRGPRVNVAVSKHQAEYLTRLGIRVDQIIYNPITLSGEMAEAKQEEANARPRILAVGRDDGVKNWPALYRLARAMPECDFFFAGVNPRSDRRGPPNVQALGFLPHTVLAPLYRRADLFISASYSETFSIALWEAVGAGISWVSTPVGAVMDLVEESPALADSLLPRDVFRWPSVVRAALLPEARSRNIELSGAFRARHLSLDVIERRYLDLVTKILND